MNIAQFLSCHVVVIRCTEPHCIRNTFSARIKPNFIVGSSTWFHEIIELAQNNSRIITVGYQLIILQDKSSKIQVNVFNKNIRFFIG